MSRPSWDDYFLKLADDAATRATCLRRKVGCIVVREHRVLTTGYNGSPPGMPHCNDVTERWQYGKPDDERGLYKHSSGDIVRFLGCDMVDGHCVRTIHAEANALMQAALHGVSTLDATLYTTCSLCINCAKLALAGGIVRVVFREEYTDTSPLELLSAARVQVVLRPTGPFQ